MRERERERASENMEGALLCIALQSPLRAPRRPPSSPRPFTSGKATVVSGSVAASSPSLTFSISGPFNFPQPPSSKGTENREGTNSPLKSSTIRFIRFMGGGPSQTVRPTAAILPKRKWKERWKSRLPCPASSSTLSMSYKRHSIRDIVLILERLRDRLYSW